MAPMTKKKSKPGADLLKEALAERKLTTRQAAKLIGGSSGGITHWCNGRRLPCRESAVKLEREFGIPVESWAVAPAPAKAAA